jgi:DNA-binding transcriptional LysR family regulator
MTDLDLNGVRTFVAIARAGTPTAAAKEVQLPTSTVSRALTRLEKHLGVLLVQRSPRGLSMADSGKEYLQSCRRALRTLKDGGELAFARAQAGSLRWLVPSQWHREVFAPLLNESLGRHPDLRIQIESFAPGWDQ